jgi:hypothetical protein
MRGSPAGEKDAREWRARESTEEGESPSDGVFHDERTELGSRGGPAGVRVRVKRRARGKATEDGASQSRASGGSNEGPELTHPIL